MKVYIQEDKLPLLKESKEEITFYGFFTQVKNFMKELLNGNVTAEPSQELKKYGLNGKELIKNLKKKGLLNSEEKIDEVPNENYDENVKEEDVDYEKKKNKLRARHTIKYSVPRRDFEKKFHRLYSELFESEWKTKSLTEEKDMTSCANIVGVVGGTGHVGMKLADKWAKYVNDNKNKPRSFFKNEKEEIQKILDNDIDGAYKKRGGYKIQENQSNIGIFYHGGDIKHDIWYNKVLWLTPQDYYAKEYAENNNTPVIWEVQVDESKLHSCSIFDFDDDFDPYEGPTEEDIENCLNDGINSYWMDYDSYDAEGLCLFNKEPILSVRQLSKEEYDSIVKWEDLDESVNLKESINNQDAPLYHYTSIGSFTQIIEDENGGQLRSNMNDGDQCVCFARCQDLDLKQSFKREIDVRMKLDFNKLQIPRGCTMQSFQANGFDDEFEERVINTKNRHRFYISNVKNSLIGVDIFITKKYNDEYGWRHFLNFLEEQFKGNTNILHFFINEYDFIENRIKNSYDLATTKQFLTDFLYKPYYDDTKENHFQNAFRAQELDRQEKEAEEEKKHIKEGLKIVSLLKKVIIDYYNNEREIFQPKENRLKQKLWMLNDWFGIDKIFEYLNHLNKEEVLFIYRTAKDFFPHKSIEYRIITLLNIVGSQAKEKYYQQNNIQESINNQDYMLYNYTGINKLKSLLTKNELESRGWDNDECICLTRNKRYIVGDTTPKIARLVINPKLIPLNKNINIRPFQARGISNKESEERIYSKDWKRFKLKDADKFITRIDINTEWQPLGNAYIKVFKGIINWVEESGVFYNKIFFQTTNEDFCQGNTQNMLNIKEFKEYLNHLEHGNFPQENEDITLRNDTIQRAEEIDAEENCKNIVEYYALLKNLDYKAAIKKWIHMQDWAKEAVKRGYQNQYLKFKDNPIYMNCLENYDFFDSLDINWNRITEWAIERVYNQNPLDEYIRKYTDETSYQGVYAVTVRFFFYGYAANSNFLSYLLNIKQLEDFYSEYMEYPYDYDGHFIFERVREIIDYYKNKEKNEKANN